VHTLVEQVGVPGAIAGKCTLSEITEKSLLVAMPIFTCQYQ
jgi:hypothetical protein